MIPLLPLVAVVALADGPRATTLQAFLTEQYDRNREAILERVAPDLRDLAKPSDPWSESPDGLPTDLDPLRKALYLHHLLTTSAPVDGTRGGVLGTVYFWHWVRPNPRHELRHLPDSALLESLPPPPEHRSYRSWADVDRTPDVFLGDLATAQPSFYHPRYGPIQTFGWCSEREMAYALLARRLFGLAVKIKFQGNHVWTEAWLPLPPQGSRRPGLVVRIDNTFDQVRSSLQTDSVSWAKDLGPGKDVVAMNRRARAAAMDRFLDTLSLGPEAAGRMAAQIQGWLHP